MQLNPYQPPSPVEPLETTVGAPAIDPSRHSLECVQFILRALVLATRDKQLSPKGIANAVGACRVALELACDLFGADGKQKLVDWGIVRSEDIGTIVYRLIDAQLVKKAENDSIDDFVGLFDFEKPPETWQLQW